jgi:hypothetical protein
MEIHREISNIFGWNNGVLDPSMLKLRKNLADLI